MKLNLKNSFLLMLLVLIIAGCSSPSENVEIIQEETTDMEQEENSPAINQENLDEDYIFVPESNFEQRETFALFQARNVCNMFKASQEDSMEAVIQAMGESEQIALELGLNMEEIEELTLQYEDDYDFQESVLIKTSEICPEEFEMIMSTQ